MSWFMPLLQYNSVVIMVHWISWLSIIVPPVVEVQSFKVFDMACLLKQDPKINRWTCIIKHSGKEKLVWSVPVSIVNQEVPEHREAAAPVGYGESHGNASILYSAWRRMAWVLAGRIRGGNWYIFTNINATVDSAYQSSSLSILISIPE